VTSIEWLDVPDLFAVMVAIACHHGRRCRERSRKHGRGERPFDKVEHGYDPQPGESLKRRDRFDHAGHRGSYRLLQVRDGKMIRESCGRLFKAIVCDQEAIVCSAT